LCKSLREIDLKESASGGEGSRSSCTESDGKEISGERGDTRSKLLHGARQSRDGSTAPRKKRNTLYQTLAEKKGSARNDRREKGNDIVIAMQKGEKRNGAAN